MLDRREFLKRCYKIGGIAAIVGMGLGAVEDAMGWGILPSVIGSGGVSTMTWATWDESSESSLATDNTFVIFGDGANSANEIGQGGALSEANRTWSQNGAMAGNGTYRTLDGNNNWFDIATGLRDFLLNLTTYGMIFKVENWAPTEDYEAIIRWGAADDLLLGATLAAGRQLRVGLAAGAASGTTAAAFATTGVHYIYLGSNGTTARFGFKATTRPTKWSDFAANDRVDLGSAPALSGLNNEADPEIFRESNGDIRECKLLFHYSVWSNNSTLIDFDS